MEEREKIARHIIEFGIKNFHDDVPEILDVEAWQSEIASKPFNLKQASEYLGKSTVTLRRWIKAGRISAYKIGRAYSMDVSTLKNFKKKNCHRIQQKCHTLSPNNHNKAGLPLRVHTDRIRNSREMKL